MVDLLCAGQNRQGVKVKVFNVEGLATHDVPESCASPLGNHGREALTGVRAGWVLSRERLLWGADPVGDSLVQYEVSLKEGGVSNMK